MAPPPSIKCPQALKPLCKLGIDPIDGKSSVIFLYIFYVHLDLEYDILLIKKVNMKVTTLAAC